MFRFVSEKDMRSLPPLLCAILLSSSAHAAMVSVTPVDFATFSLDVDGDGQAEVSQIIAQTGEVGFGIKVDGTAAGSYVTFPDVTFAGAESRAFTSLSALSLDSLFSGTFTAPAAIHREFNNFGGIGVVTAAAPIHAAWNYGTAGTGSGPLSLVGVVMDFSAYFTSGGTAAVDIYYHHYGNFSAGQSAGSISLATTGVPEPTSSMMLLTAITSGLLRRRRDRC